MTNAGTLFELTALIIGARGRRPVSSFKVAEFDPEIGYARVNLTVRGGQYAQEHRFHHAYDGWYCYEVHTLWGVSRLQPVTWRRAS